MALHPDVEKFLREGRELGEMLGALRAAAFDDLRVRRACPDEPNLLPEIDGYGALTDLWMEGIVERYTPAEIERIFMAAIAECYAVLEDRRNAAASAVVPEDRKAELGLG